MFEMQNARFSVNLPPIAIRRISERVSIAEIVFLKIAACRKDIVDRPASNTVKNSVTNYPQGHKTTCYVYSFIIIQKRHY